jgi:hypothetical protein
MYHDASIVAAPGDHSKFRDIPYKGPVLVTPAGSGDPALYTICGSAGETPVLRQVCDGALVS